MLLSTFTFDNAATKTRVEIFSLEKSVRKSDGKSRKVGSELPIPGAFSAKQSVTNNIPREKPEEWPPAVFGPQSKG